MIGYFVLSFFISLCSARCKTSDSMQASAVSNLDAAMDFIIKAKYSFPKCEKSPGDCSELLEMGHDKSGVYMIWPESRITEDRSVEVYCDMKTDGGGWTLIQRRGNYQRAQDYFYQDWKSYKEGFGDVEKDFWLGNDNIFALTNKNLYSVWFDLRDVENSTRYAKYDKFWIDDEDHNYTLHIADYSRDAGDSMIGAHNNQQFSTKDRDNDVKEDHHCAASFKGGWWYGACHSANLNGLYLRGKHESYANGVNWKTWKGYNESMESTEIKIRPKKFKLRQALLDTPM